VLSPFPSNTVRVTSNAPLPFKDADCLSAPSLSCPPATALAVSPLLSLSWATPTRFASSCAPLLVSLACARFLPLTLYFEFTLLYFLLLLKQNKEP
jgi:hypothetical protein